MPPSDPVVIPARRSATTASIRREATTTTPPRRLARGENARGESGRRSTSRRQGTSPAHRPDAIPPAVAALLAVTSIPPPRPKRNPMSTRTPNATLDKGQPRTVRVMSTVFDEKDDAHDDSAMLLSRSPLEILLSPAEELEEEDTFSQTTDETSSPTPPPVGSRSLDSSAPSLEIDHGSQTSLGSPPSPAFAEERRASGSPRKEKPVSSPPAEDCVLDHPLLSRYAMWSDHPSAIPHQGSTTTTSDGSRLARSRRPAPISRPSSFRSNLTASLRVLRSAAKSFSNFTVGPTIQADDFLTRSILSISPQFTDERWPGAPLEETPTPAMRRYLNPPPATSGVTNDSPAGSLLTAGRQHQGSVCHDDKPWTGAIQLQTYRTSTATRQASGSSSALNSTSKWSSKDRKPADRSHPSLTSPSSSLSPAIQGPVARNREPRENSDFLRVIVLEMNMRREGKLSDSSPGKARFVLPPRQKVAFSARTGIEDVNDGLESSCSISGPQRSGARAAGRRTVEVPRRWVGVVAR